MATYKYKWNRTGGDIFLTHLLWLGAAVVTFGGALIFYPPWLAGWVIEGVEMIEKESQ